MAKIHTGQPGNTPFKENWHNKQITMEEEAQRLVEQFEWCTFVPHIDYLLSREEAKQCAKKCVEEILKSKIHFLGIKADNENIIFQKIKEEHQQLLKEIDKL